MKLFYKTSLILGSSALLLFSGIFYIIGGEPGFEGSYQSVIQIKYDNLVNQDKPKIIFVGGSNLSFGINEALLSEKTGYEVANLGLHAGFGNLFPTELSKKNINKGDIVILIYEYGWEAAHSFETFGVDLVMSGIDNKIEMYSSIPIRKYSEILDYLPTYSSKKNTTDFKSLPEGSYSAALFNDKGQMIYSREENAYNLNEDHAVKIDKFEISKESKEYITEYREFVESQGAVLLFSAPAVFDSAIKSTDAILTGIPKTIENELDIKYISNPLDYMFDQEFIYDSPYHLTSEGEIMRTEQLIFDLVNSGALDN